MITAMIRKFLVKLVGMVRRCVRIPALRVPVLVTVVRGWLAVNLMTGVTRAATSVPPIPVRRRGSSVTLPSPCGTVAFSFHRR